MPNWATNEELLAQASRLSGLLSTIPIAKVRSVLMVLIVVWFLSLLADIFWLLVPSPELSANQAAQMVRSQKRATKQGQKPAYDMASMKSWHLFGVVAEGKSEQDSQDVEAQANQPGDIADAQETRLQLKLLGVIVAEEGAESHAVIEHQSESELYKVGDKLPGGRDVTLAWVLTDRAILDNSGVRESLFLYEEEEEKPVAPASRKPQSRSADSKREREPVTKVLDQRNNERLSEMANDYRQQLLENPMSLADVIKVSVAKDAEGSVIGYRIRPGRDRQQFAEFGLKSGDIVTSINGLPLDDPAKAMELYGQLREAKEASFVVKRGSEEINLIVGLSK